MRTQLQYVCMYVCMQHIVPSNATEIVKWGRRLKQHSCQRNTATSGGVYGVEKCTTVAKEQH